MAYLFVMEIKLMILWEMRIEKRNRMIRNEKQRDKNSKIFFWGCKVQMRRKREIVTKIFFCKKKKLYYFTWIYFSLNDI